MKELIEFKILSRWLIPIAKLVWAIWLIGITSVLTLGLSDYCGDLALRPQYQKPMAAILLHGVPVFCWLSMLTIAAVVIYRTAMSLVKREAEKKEGKDETDNQAIRQS